jgi:hypothetical protein
MRWPRSRPLLHQPAVQPRPKRPQVGRAQAKKCDGKKNVFVFLIDRDAVTPPSSRLP